MTKATKTAAALAPAPTLAPAQTEPEAPASQVICEVSQDCRVTTRDVYAAQALSAIVCGIVTRGGLVALHTTLDDDALMTTVFRLADDAMQAREA